LIGARLEAGLGRRRGTTGFPGVGRHAGPTPTAQAQTAAAAAARAGLAWYPTRGRWPLHRV